LPELVQSSKQNEIMESQECKDNLEFELNKQAKLGLNNHRDLNM